MPASRKVEHRERIKNRLRLLLNTIAPRATADQKIAILYDISRSLGMKKLYQRRIYNMFSPEVQERVKDELPELCAELMGELEPRPAETHPARTRSRGSLANYSFPAA